MLQTFLNHSWAQAHPQLSLTTLRCDSLLHDPGPTRVQSTEKWCCLLIPLFTNCFKALGMVQSWSPGPHTQSPVQYWHPECHKEAKQIWGAAQHQRREDGPCPGLTHPLIHRHTVLHTTPYSVSKRSPLMTIPKTGFSPKPESQTFR